jgi:hypothetical protein
MLETAMFKCLDLAPSLIWNSRQVWNNIFFQQPQLKLLMNNLGQWIKFKIRLPDTAVLGRHV